MHARHTPVEHRFSYPFYFYAIDLDELSELDKKVRGFGYNHWSPVSLRDDDYLRGSGSFRERLSEFINVKDIDRIILVTVARFFRKVFNPVSFYYCLKKDGTAECMVAEVNNTFGERHLYVLGGGDQFPLECSHDKQFHVSPFNNMLGGYQFKFSKPDEDLRISIKLIRDNETVMDAVMWGEGKPLTTATLWKTVLRYPFSALLTMPRITCQAALLHFKKKLPAFTKPDPDHPMTIKVKS